MGDGVLVVGGWVEDDGGDEVGEVVSGEEVVVLSITVVVGAGNVVDGPEVVVVDCTGKVEVDDVVSGVVLVLVDVVASVVVVVSGTVVVVVDVVVVVVVVVEGGVSPLHTIQCETVLPSGESYHTSDAG